jgi:acetoin utilization deacetylase AcuC-like enzyme
MEMAVVAIYDVCTPHERHVKNSSNQPEIRSLRIRQDLERQGIQLLSNANMLSQSALLDLKIHQSQYIDFLESAYADAVHHADPDWFSTGELVPNHFVNFNSNAIYMNALRNSNLPLYKLSGFYGNDTMSPIVASTYSQAMMSANNTYRAAELAHMDPRVVLYALNASPGHHASSHGYSGYCFINNGAVAARRFQQLGRKKVAILDLDYHAGNGTQDIFYSDPSVLTISIHADPRVEYPSFSGFADEVGIHDGLGFNLNLPLAPKTTWETYSIALATAMTRIQEFGAEAVVLAFGGDTYKDDPDASGIAGFSLDLADYPKMGHQIRAAFSGPIVVTQEGGYHMDHIGQIASSFVRALAVS